MRPPSSRHLAPDLGQRLRSLLRRPHVVALNFAARRHPAMTTPPTTSHAKLAGIVALTLVLSLFFFSPVLWLLQQPTPGSFQWDRALTFLRQCEAPLRKDVETAMQWRLLPALAAYTLRLPGYAPLALPWLGAIAATAYVAVLFRRRCGDPRVVLGGTLVFASTSAVIVPLGLLGLNDAWVWLGLLTVAFGRAAWTLPVACLLCPWVDERFIIGFPLAWYVARIDRGEPIFSRALMAGLWLVPYATLRLWLSRLGVADSNAQSSFLSYCLHSFPSVAPLIPLGWWFGLRAAWAGVVFALCHCPARYRLVGSLTLVATLGATALLAHDLSRSIAILVPLVVLGGVQFIRLYPALAPRVFLLTGLLALLLPAAHVIYRTIQPINPLPLEAIRLLHAPAKTP